MAIAYLANLDLCPLGSLHMVVDDKGVPVTTGFPMHGFA